MMEPSVIKKIGMIVLSFLVGAILTILPLPHWAVWARPEWVLVILIFWVVSQPQYVGLCVAFCVGIFVDLLTGTLLGQHALVFALVVYLLSQVHPQLKNFPLWQQLGIICILTLLQLALQCWILDMIGTPPRSWEYWMPALTSTLIWLWFYMLLKEKQEAIGDFQ